MHKLGVFYRLKGNKEYRGLICEGVCFIDGEWRFERIDGFSPSLPGKELVFISIIPIWTDEAEDPPDR